MRYVLTVAAAPLFALGWLVGVLALVALWCWAAALTGWDAARSGAG